MAAMRSLGRMFRSLRRMAFASKYRDEDRVTLCFFGDGAINQGAFHEALNLAGLKQAADCFYLREQPVRDGNRAWSARPHCETKSSIARKATIFQGR